MPANDRTIEHFDACLLKTFLTEEGAASAAGKSLPLAACTERRTESMAFWCFMLATDLLVPLIMIAFGGVFARHAPKEINGLVGYRTPRSMRNQDTWRFAHRYSGRLMFRWGLALLPLSVLALLPVLGQGEEVIGTAGAIICCVQMIPLFGIIAATERALKHTFDDSGKRR